MISRRLHLPQCPARQWPHHRVLAVRPLTTRAKKDGSSASSTSLDLRSSSSSSQSSPSLYQKLFSKGGDSEPANPRFVRRSRASSQEPSETPHPGRSRSAQKTDNKEKSVLPLGDELRAWFENAVEEEKKSKDPDAGATVLVLNNASRSLVESDFYRLAPQGKHVEGWAGGITKVVQSISSLTREPQGQYYLFFDTRAAADLYVRELQRLWRLAREILRSSPWPDNFFLPHEKNFGLDDPLRTNRLGRGGESLRTYTVLPPTAIPLSYSLHTPSELSALITLSTKTKPFQSQSQRQSNPKALRHPPLAPLSPTAHLPSGLLTHLSLHIPPPTDPSLPLEEDHPPLPVTDAISIDHRVLLHFHGSKVSLPAMQRLLKADGAERNLPWRLAEQRDRSHQPPAIDPVKAGSGEVDWPDAAKEEAAMRGVELKKEVGYQRFVVSFAEVGEARRFARVWHRREVEEERTGREMVVEATALW